MSIIYNNSRVPLNEANVGDIWVEQVIECPECKGTGSETFYDYNEDEGHTSTQGQCRTCLGSKKYTKMVKFTSLLKANSISKDLINKITRV